MLLHPDFVQILIRILGRYGRIAVLVRSGRSRIPRYVFVYTAFIVSKDSMLQMQQTLTYSPDISSARFLCNVWYLRAQGKSFD